MKQDIITSLQARVPKEKVKHKTDPRSKRSAAWETLLEDLRLVEAGMLSDDRFVTRFKAVASWVADPER